MILEGAMAQRILEIHPDALAEIRGARERYQQHSRDASEGFFTRS